MDLASMTLCEYETIIAFQFEFLSVQNFKAFFWILLFLKSVYAVTQNLLDQLFEILNSNFSHNSPGTPGSFFF